MPIFNASKANKVRIDLAEGYTYADMGRIMQENVRNDNIVFNAALMRDFKEVTAVREGTMLESELRSFQEFSIKEAWASLKEKLKKLWTKIKNVFRAVYAKLTVWLVRDGKTFVAMHRKYLQSKPNLKNCEIPKYRKPKPGANLPGLVDTTTVKGTNFDDVLKATPGTKDQTVEEVKLEFIQGKLSSFKDGDDLHDAVYDYAFDDESTGETFGQLGLSLVKLFDNISGSSKAIKDLKKAEKAADKSIKKVIDKLNRGPKDSELKDLSDDESSAVKKSYEKARNYCSGMETYMTSMTKEVISAIKFGVRQDRMVVGKLVAFDSSKYNSANESAILEQMAWLEGADDFDTQEDTPVDEIEADDVCSDPDVQVNINVDSDED